MNYPFAKSMFLVDFSLGNRLFYKIAMTMNMSKYGFLGFLFFYLFLTACTKLGTRQPSITHNETFDTIQQTNRNNNRAYCITLIDSTQNLSKKFIDGLKYEDWTCSTASYNIIDINLPQNEWYIKWLVPVSLPVTCIFTSDGHLIDLIPGAAKESFLYIKRALSDLQTTEYHYPNRFSIPKNELIPILGNILECNMGLSEGIYLKEKLSQIYDSLPYPYPYYIGIVGALAESDTAAALSLAHSMLKLENPYYLDVFRDEFIVAKKTINPRFNIKDEATIRTNSTQILLSDCLSGKDNPFTITIFNDGKRPLNIFKIFKSCSCLELKNHHEKFIIAPKDSTKVDFIFKAEEKGDFLRDIFITSNAINAPILYLEVLANVQ